MPRLDRLLLPVAFAVAALAMLFVSALGYRALRLAAESSRSVAHTQQALTAFEDILGSVFDAEAAGRTYEVTSNESDLEPLLRTESLLPAAVDSVADLTADNVAHQHRIPQLGDKSRKYCAYSIASSGTGAPARPSPRWRTSKRKPQPIASVRRSATCESRRNAS
jgi:methyl-accepting chemotaxis protein